MMGKRVRAAERFNGSVIENIVGQRGGRTGGRMVSCEAKAVVREEADES